MESLVLCTNTSELVQKFEALGLFGRMSSALSTLRITPSDNSSVRYKTSGMSVSRGEFLMHSSSEWPNDADVSFLSDILETTGEHLRKYCLSLKACEGILRRAASRGKELPARLAAALKAQIARFLRTRTAAT
jgi:hypothetical protein